MKKNFNNFGMFSCLQRLQDKPDSKESLNVNVLLRKIQNKKITTIRTLGVANVLIIK